MFMVNKDEYTRTNETRHLLYVKINFIGRYPIYPSNKTRYLARRGTWQKSREQIRLLYNSYRPTFGSQLGKCNKVRAVGRVAYTRLEFAKSQFREVAALEIFTRRR